GITPRKTASCERRLLRRLQHVFRALPELRGIMHSKARQPPRSRPDTSQLFKELRFIERCPAITASPKRSPAVGGARDQLALTIRRYTITGARTTAANSFPKLTALGNARSAGPRSIITM